MPKIMNICGVEGWKKVSVGSICGYWRQGLADKPVLHLLHGNGFSGLSLLALVNELPKDWSLLVTDMPGHGESAAVTNPGFPVWEKLAAELAQYVQSVLAAERVAGVPGSFLPVIGVGHSMGGILTLMMAHQCPGLFQQLILLDPVLFSPVLIRAQKVLQMTRLWRRNPLVRRASARRCCWPSAAAAGQYLGGKALYKDWHALAFDGFLTTGLRPQENGSVALACSPLWEARVFASAPLGLWQTVRQTTIPVHILVAASGFGFIAPGARRASRLNPLLHHERVAGNHCFPMEHPGPTARRIIELTRAASVCPD
jgi:pimeloyl-ACP methyl ester carboxylesterase